MTHWGRLEAEMRTSLMAEAPDWRVDDAGLSWYTQIHCAASEFWAAATRRALMNHVACSPVSRLLLGEVAFTTIGLAGVARIVRRGRRDLVKYPHASAIWRITGDIETDCERLDKSCVAEALRQFAAATETQHRVMRQEEIR